MAEHEDVFKYADSVADSAAFDAKTTRELENFLHSLDTYDTVYVEKHMPEFSDLLHKYRLLWHREDLVIIKSQLRFLRKELYTIHRKQKITHERTRLVETLLRHTYSTTPEYQILKNQHDALERQKYDSAPGSKLQIEYTRLVQQEREKRPGLEKQRV